MVRPKRSGRALHHSFHLTSLTKRHMRSMISGSQFMDLRNLVNAMLGGDLLSARQWVADAQREKVTWERLECPRDFDGHELIVAAALVELLAGRAGENAPTWTHAVGAEREPVVLD